MDFTTYRLPDGRLVPVDASAAKGALVIGFTLVGGRVVEAIRADSIHQPLVSVCAWHETTPIGVDVTHRICAACAAKMEG